MSAYLDKLTRRIKRLEDEVRGRATTPQLGNSSIDSGALLLNDVNGVPQVVIGHQDDGTVMVNHVAGPPPPQPTAPVLGSAIGFITVSWDGLFVGGAPAPSDFSHVEVHASTDGSFTPDDTNLYATVLTQDAGGQAAISVPYDDDYHVRLVAKSLSNQASVPSDEAVGSARKIDHIDITPLSIEAEDIADFAIPVVKFQSTTHLIY